MRPLVKLATACHSEELCSEESIKTQGTKERYAHRKHRNSTMVAQAAIAAVKLATACTQGLETFSKVWRMSHIVRNKGKSTTAYIEVREDTFVLKFLY